LPPRSAKDDARRQGNRPLPRTLKKPIGLSVTDSFLATAGSSIRFDKQWNGGFLFHVCS
jgi:hypothetical protein